MANELKHTAVGTELTQAEYEGTASHVFNSQATGDIVYASSASQLTRLGIGSSGQVLKVSSGGIPEWGTDTTNVAAGSLTGTTMASNVVTSSLTTVGALNAGSITSGFGTINNGSSTITTTGAITGGSLDVNGGSQFDGTVSVGVDDTGYDVKFFGATASSYMLYDASEDDLYIIGGKVAVGNSTTMGAGDGGINLQNDGGYGIFLQESNSQNNYFGVKVNETSDITTLWSGSGGSVTTPMAFYTAISGSEAERMRIDGTGLSIGGFAPAYDLDVADNDAHTQSAVTTYSDSTHASYFYLRKSHSDTLGTATTTIDGETLGKFYFLGVDSGGGFDSGASIIGIQTGTAGAKVPTYMKFETSTDSASAEAMRIRETGAVQIGGAGIAQRTNGMLDINASNTYPRLSITSWSASDYPAYLQLSQSQNDTMGTMTATADGASHGYIRFEGVDSGGNFDLGSSIHSQQDGASGTRVPANLIFTTSTSSSPTEKMRIMGSGQVGIGTSAPDHLLTLANSAATSQIELRGGGVAGGGAFFCNYANQTAVMSAGVRVNAGSWTADTTSSGGSGSASIYAQVGSTHYWYSNGSTTDGNNISPAQVFTIVAGGNATLAGTLTESSDARLKTNINTIDSALDKVTQMRGVTYDRTDFDMSGTGIVAQELERIAPELVENNDEYKSVAYTKLTAYLIEAIKELNNEIKELKGN